jgi:AcrR family transcriptional regulator
MNNHVDPVPSKAPVKEGLRAKQQRLLRNRLSKRALRLFRKQGFEKTTVDEIVEAELVSRSTFFRYFRTKEDVILSMLDEMGAAWIEQFRISLAEENPKDALRHSSILAVERFGTDSRLVDVMQLTWETPPLRARRLEKIVGWQLELEALIAEHIGSSPSDLLPGLLVRIHEAAGEAAFEAWIHNGCVQNIVELQEEAFRLLDLGFKNIQIPRRVRCQGAPNDEN